jgi:hypothetical protein
MSAAPVTQPFTWPNHYQLSGGGISVTYLPTGAGGVAHLQYQDSQRTLTFSGDQIRVVEVPDIGSIVSVTLTITVDTGSTTFSVLIPKVTLPTMIGSSVHICTQAITTVHRFSLVPLFNAGQDEIYTITELRGTESTLTIPL